MSHTLELPRRFRIHAEGSVRTVTRRTVLEVAEIELGYWLQPLLNGDRMKRVTAYDIDAGWIEAYPVDLKGELRELRTVRMHGEVGVALRDCEWARAAYGYWHKLRGVTEAA